MAPTPSIPITCVDTSNWTNGAGHDCASYERHWCINGGARENKEFTLGITFNSPEKHCCVCGGGTVHAPPAPIMSEDLVGWACGGNGNGHADGACPTYNGATKDTAIATCLACIADCHGIYKTNSNNHWFYCSKSKKQQFGRGKADGSTAKFVCEADETNYCHGDEAGQSECKSSWCLATSAPTLAPTVDPPYVAAEFNTDICPAGYEVILDQAACETAAPSMELSFKGTRTWNFDNFAKGCLIHLIGGHNGVYFNTESGGTGGNSMAKLLCKLQGLATAAPMQAPTLKPTSSPTPLPTPAPTPLPTPFPTPSPTSSPTVLPTLSPTPAPILAPTPLST
jgi:hypothetical protein